MSQSEVNRSDFTVVNTKDVEMEDVMEWNFIWEELAGQYAEEISISHLTEAIKNTRAGRNLSDELIVSVLKSADTNKDGVLQKSEFMNIVQSTPPSGFLRKLLRESAWCAIPVSERDVTTRYYYEEYTCCPPPLFIPLMSLAQIAVFIYYSVDMDLPTGPMSPCPTYSPLVYDPSRRYEAWRYISYMFVHSGYMHIISNLFTQLVFGLILEMVHGPLRLSAIYIAGVLAGSLATSLSTPGFFLAGASGGVYAIQYAHLGNLIINWDEMKYPVPQAAFIAIMSVVTIGYSIYDAFFIIEASHTGHLAHIGGAIFGLLLGVSVLRNLKKHDWERYCMIAAIVLMSVLTLSAVLVNIFATDYYPENDYRSLDEVKENWMLQNHGYNY